MLKETLDFISTSFLLEWMNNLLSDLNYYFEYEDFSTSLFAFHSFWAKFISRAYNKIKKEKKNSSYVEFQQINGSKGRGRSRCQGYEWYVVATRKGEIKRGVQLPAQQCEIHLGDDARADLAEKPPPPPLPPSLSGYWNLLYLWLLSTCLRHAINYPSSLSPR